MNLVGDPMKNSLYRKYRPQTFSDMVGQSSAIEVLQTALKSNNFGHAYLFSGPRGCGKTTIARIMAKSICCTNRRDNAEPCDECDSCVAISRGEHLDVMEMDGASNNGVDNIRDLKTHVSLRALSSQYKIYIIDEVHMLSIGAFNALLKTLEEPPENVVFILATTEPHKVPVTIRSRCQHIPFHRIKVQDIVSRLEYVCEKEGIKADSDGLWEIARLADGALRDALSLLEQAISIGNGEVTKEAVNEITGGASRSSIEAWVASLLSNPEEAASTLTKIISSGTSCERLAEQIFIVFTNLWYANLWQKDIEKLLEISTEEANFLREEAKKWDEKVLRRCAYVTQKIQSKAHIGINGEYFGGLLFLELKNAIDGVEYNQVATPPPARGSASFQPQRAVPQAPNNVFVEPLQKQEPPRKTAKPAESIIKANTSFDERVENFTAIKSEKIDTSNFTRSFGDSPFAKIIAEIPQDNYEFAAALLHAKILQNDSEISFEAKDAPSAQAFLNIPFNKQIATLAVKKVFGLLPQEDEKEKSAPTEKEMQTPTTQPEQPIEGKNEVASVPSNTVSSNISRVLKLAGAELLYEEKDTIELGEEKDG